MADVEFTSSFSHTHGLGGVKDRMCLCGCKPTLKQIMSANGSPLYTMTKKSCGFLMTKGHCLHFPVKG